MTVCTGSDERQQVLIGLDRDILQAHKSGFKKEFEREEGMHPALSCTLQSSL